MKGCVQDVRVLIHAAESQDDFTMRYLSVRSAIPADA